MPIFSRYRKSLSACLYASVFLLNVHCNEFDRPGASPGTPMPEGKGARCGADGIPSGDASALALYPGSVADSDGANAYLQTVSGLAVERFDSGAGHTIWTSTDALFPLVAVDECVLVAGRAEAQANASSLTVLVLARGDARKLRASDPLQLPEWVNVNGGIGLTFQARGRLADGKLVVKWEAHQRYAGGAYPGPGVVLPTKDAYGLAALEVGTGHWKALLQQDTPLPPERSLPASLASLTSAPYWTGADTLTTPIVVDGKVITLSITTTRGVQRLDRLAWDLSTGASLPTVELLSGPSLFPQLSGDGAHLFVTVVSDQSSLPSSEQGHLIFELSSGARVGQLPLQPRLSFVSVAASTAFLVTLADAQDGGPAFGTTRRTLEARSLPAGARLWDHPILPLYHYFVP